MQKLLLSCNSRGDMATFEYGDNGLLKELRIIAILNKEQIDFILSNCSTPLCLSVLLRDIQTKDKTASVEEMSQDLSFERFWEEYNHKVGKKARVQKKWEAMSEPERIKALKYIKKYSYFLAERPTIEKKYPETYLNTAEWNN